LFLPLPPSEIPSEAPVILMLDLFADLPPIGEPVYDYTKEGKVFRGYVKKISHVRNGWRVEVGL